MDGVVRPLMNVHKRAEWLAGLKIWVYFLAALVSNQPADLSHEGAAMP